jgi:hypothetical protein
MSLSLGLEGRLIAGCITVIGRSPPIKGVSCDVVYLEFEIIVEDFRRDFFILRLFLGEG